MMMNGEDWDDPSINEYNDMQKYGFVTQRAIEMNYVGYCYRENSDIKIDSGWRFLYGDEDEEYLENPDNTMTKDLSEIVEWKPEVKTILSSRQGSDFEWNSETKSFEQL